MGKWHLGWKPQFGPNEHGFDEFFGIRAEPPITSRTRRPTPPVLPAVRPVVPISWENLAPIERAGYMTDLLTDRAVEIIGRRHTKPFSQPAVHGSAFAVGGAQDAAIDHNDHGPGPMVGGGRGRFTAR